MAKKLATDQRISNLSKSLEDASNKLQAASGLGGVAITVLFDPRTSNLIGIGAIPDIQPAQMVQVLRAAADAIVERMAQAVTNKEVQQ